MVLNENTVKGKWLEIKGELRKAWGKLTDDELEKTHGDMQQISGLIQQKYGEGQESYRKQLNDIFDRYENRKDQMMSDVKDRLRN